MIKIYNNILTNVECERIHNSFFAMINSNDSNLDYEEKNKYYVKNVVGTYDLKESLPLADRILQKISMDYGFDYAFNNTYIRLYKNESFLTQHVDRPNLDITLSVNISSTTKTDWPIFVSDILYKKEHWDPNDDFEQYKRSSKSYTTKKGDGIAIFGRKHVHWREPLVCGENEYILQIFYHFKKVRSFGRPVEITYE